MRLSIIVLIFISCVICEERVLKPERFRRTIYHIRRGLRGLVRQASEGQLKDAIKNATDSIIKNFLNGKESLLIAPGTKWCGAGNIAEDSEHLGVNFEADICCRDHDRCFDNIPANKEKHGLVNNNPFTISHCDCDRQFFRCLKAGDTVSTTTIGVTYFNILRPKCFAFDYPVIDCVTVGQRYPKTEDCQEYMFDFSQPKQWQLFDALDWTENI